MRSRNEIICKRMKYVAITAAHQNSPQCGKCMRWCHAFGVAGWNGWYIMGWQWLLLNTKLWFQWKWMETWHILWTNATNLEARPTQWLEQYSWQSVSFVKSSRFTISKLLWTFERHRCVFGHHSHGPHATKMLRFREELKGNVKAQKHLLDTTAPN